MRRNKWLRRLGKRKSDANSPDVAVLKMSANGYSDGQTRNAIRYSGNGKAAPVEDLSPLGQSRHYFRTVFAIPGMMGLFFSFLQLPVLAINSYLLSMRFEVIFRTPGMPLFTVNLWGWYREISEYDIFGLLISTGIMAAAAAFAFGWFNRNKTSSLILYTALAGWVTLAVFEVVVSVYGGIATDGSVVNALLSGLLALGIVAVEGLFGVFVIDYFLAPLCLSVLWALAIPLQFLGAVWRALRHKLRAGAPARREAREARRHQREQRAADKPRSHRLATFLRALDEALFQPLRTLDRFVYDGLKKAVQPKKHAVSPENSNQEVHHENSRHV